MTNIDKYLKITYVTLLAQLSSLLGGVKLDRGNIMSENRKFMNEQ